MNATISVRLTNAYNYVNTILTPSNQVFQIPLDSQIDDYTFENSETEYPIALSNWSPQLFPFDDYNYTFNLPLPDYVNRSIWLGPSYPWLPVEPYVVYENYIALNPFTPLPERIDNSIWVLNSYVTYYPSNNFTARPPTLKVTILLERNAEFVNYPFLLPVFSLFAILGLSVLLADEKQLANRLLLYLTVFGLYYSLEPSIRNSSIAPAMIGFSLIDRLVISLIPCILIFSSSSVIASTICHLKSFKEKAYELAVFVGCDAAAAILSALATNLITSVTVTNYLNNPFRIEFQVVRLVNVGPFGMAVVGALFAGVFVNFLICEAKLRNLGDSISARH